MKIGILTFHRPINYGAFLQCYSLVNYLRDNIPGAEVEVIDYETKTERWIRAKGRIKDILESDSLHRMFESQKMYKGFARDLHKYLPLSKKRIVSNRADSLMNNYSNDYDVVVVGSDAVWNNISTSSSENFFLAGVECKYKFSYAASTSGLDIEGLDIIETEKIKKYLADFTYIGVREEKGERFVAKIDSNLISFHNCDPTCFINLDNIKVDFKEKFIANGIDTNKPKICLMTRNETVGKKVKEAFGATHQIVSIYTYNKYSDVHLYDLSPIEFAVFFKEVDLLFSFFFHGCYLCLKNGTPVIAVDEDNDMGGKDTKIMYLFNRLGISDWYYRPESMDNSDYDIMMTKAKSLIKTNQKEYICKKLEEEKTYSDSFLKTLKALNIKK